MKYENNYETILLDHISSLSNLIFPFIGLGPEVKSLIDLIATYQFDFLFDDLKKYKNNISILSVEGKRDGITGTEIQKKIHAKEYSDVYLAIDPVDGTLTTSKGGSRGMSVVGISENFDNKKYKLIPDQFSCLSIASNIEKEFIDNLNIFDGHIGKDSFKNDFINKKISFINRKDTFDLLSDMLRIKTDDFFNNFELQLGENTGYSQNLCICNNLFVSDSTISLPLESDYFLGRTGIAEARLESYLWKHWKGILVSSSKMKKYSKGTNNYFKDRLLSVNNLDYSLLDFFEEEEIEILHKYGWTNDEIRGYINTSSFTPNYSTIIISSLTGTWDKKLTYLPNNYLNPLKYDNIDKKLIIEYWIVQDKCIKKKKCTKSITKLCNWFKYLNWNTYLHFYTLNNTDQKNLNLINYFANLEQGKGIFEEWKLEDVKRIQNL